MALNIKNIDLNLFSIFVALMHDKNLSHAADNLGMTQPSVSQALKRLRILYDDPLFERKSGKMMPTLKANSIYPSISRILSEVIDTLPEQNTFDPKTSEQIFHINLLGIHHNLFIPKLMKYLSVHAPNVHIRVSSDVLSDIEKSLKNREYDLHFDYIINEQSGCHSSKLFMDKLFVIAAKEHPRFSKITSLSIDDYMNEGHAVLKPRDNNTFPLGLAASEMINSNDRKVRYSTDSVTSIIETVSVTDLICTMPIGLLRTLPNKSDLLAFNPPFTAKTISAYMNWHWTTEHHKSLRWFREVVTNICQEVGYFSAVESSMGERIG